MSKKDMAKLIGLHLRAGVYQLRILIPLDLQASYEGKTKITKSLGTSNLREAHVLGTQARANALQGFEAKRRSLRPQVISHITKEMTEYIANEISRLVALVDDVARDNPESAAELLRTTVSSSLVIPTASFPVSAAKLNSVHLSRFAGLSDELADAWAQNNKSSKEFADRLMAKRDLTYIYELAARVTAAIGLTLREDTPGIRDLLKVCLEAYRDAWIAMTRRDRGETIPNPEKQAITGGSGKPVETQKLRDIFDRWKKARPRSPDSVRACLRALSKFEECLGNTPLKDLSRSQGDTFRAWIQAQPIASKTARDQFTWIKTLLKYAHRDLEVINRNPWEGLEISFKTTTKRRPWTPEELNILFGQPLFTTYQLPRAAKAGLDAAYWIPLLGLYTGARIGELAQLRTSNIFKVDEHFIIEVTDLDEGKKLKTAASNRRIPVHPELVRLGFLDYVAAVHAAGHTSIWPRLKLNANKPGAGISAWFGTFRRSIGLSDKNPDFHCFRHSVRTQMSRAGVDPKVQDHITGHSTSGSIGVTVYQNVDETDLVQAIASLNYPGMSLRRSYGVSSRKIS